MKNNSNIYDIDGELIRAIDDNHEITVQEAQEKIDFYKNKLEQLTKDDPKKAVYETYIANLNRYIVGLYSKMTPDELNSELNRQKIQQDTDKQVEKAINELKKEIENEKDTEAEEHPATGSEDSDTEEAGRTQEDLLTDGGGRPETVMDEYVDFEEV